MKQPALVIIKPDGIVKNLTGHALTKFATTGLEIVGARVIKTSRAMAERHYAHLKSKPFFDELVTYFCGEYHKQNKLIALVYYGEDAVRKCRSVAGATNPEEAAPVSVRGAYGRITTKGVYENVVHVSSDQREAKREIQLWFRPDDIAANIYPTKTEKINSNKRKIWA